VSDVFIFKPPRRQGLVLHITLILLLAAASGWSLWKAFQSVIGPVFLLYLLLALLTGSLVPLLVYRAYSLYKAFYKIERDGIRLNWGLRYEDIPMDSVLWVRLAEEMFQAQPWLDPEGQPQNPALSQALPLPLIRWPGAVLGTRHLAGGEQVEFMAAKSGNGLILIATSNKIFVVSPANPAAFLQTFHRFAELGSFTPLEARSIYPSFLLARVWNERPARYLLLTGLALSLILFIGVSLVAPGHTQISLGFNPIGSLREPVPIVQLLLLPLVSAFFFLVDLLLGLFFYRRSSTQFPKIPFTSELSLPFARILAYILWISGTVTPLLFLIALWFILRVQ
jgi:hypothetical protein